MRLIRVGLCAAIVIGCDSDDKVVPADTTPRPSARPLDRLAPGELAPGKVQVYGFVAPREMRLERKYPDAAHLIGAVSPEGLSNYVRERVAAQHVEVGAARTVFPKVAIKGGPKDHVFRIEVVAAGSLTRLLIKDITPPPTAQGLSEAERWKRAGMTPDGKLLNPKKMQ